MTRERNTRRISNIINKTNGKKERIAFAATEKAKVCTSVRIRYLAVERTSPERLRRGGGGGGGTRVAAGCRLAGVEGLVTRSLKILSEEGDLPRLCVSY